MPNRKIEDGFEGNPQRRYYLRNRAKVLVASRLRRLANPERTRFYTAQHRLRKYGPRIPLTPTGRFMKKVEVVTESGCWLWLGTVQKNGYGRFGYGEYRSGLAHRWSYQTFVGPIPRDKELDHLCRVRCCVNPDHLRVVTHAENMAARC
jgi:HNH endonuclease